MTNEDLILKVLSDRHNKRDALSAKDVCGTVNIPHSYMSTYVKKLRDKGWKIAMTNESPPRYYMKSRYQEKKKKDKHVKEATWKIGKILESLPKGLQAIVLDSINKRYGHP